MFGKRVKVERSWTVARAFLEVAGERVPTLGNFSFARRARAFSVVKEKKSTFCEIMRILIYWSNKVSWLVDEKNRPMINIKFLWPSRVLKSLYGKNEKNVREFSLILSVQRNFSNTIFYMAYFHSTNHFLYQFLSFLLPEIEIRMNLSKLIHSTFYHFLCFIQHYWILIYTYDIILHCYSIQYLKLDIISTLWNILFSFIQYNFTTSRILHVDWIKSLFTVQSLYR